MIVLIVMMVMIIVIVMMIKVNHESNDGDYDNIDDDDVHHQSSALHVSINYPTLLYLVISLLSALTRIIATMKARNSTMRMELMMENQCTYMIRIVD